MDLPGSYSLDARSAEEEVTRDYILKAGADAAIIVCDASCLERNLILALQILEHQPSSVLCINLMDEAAKKGIVVNLALLSERLHIPVVGTSARSKKGLDELMDAVENITDLKGADTAAPQESTVQSSPTGSPLPLADRAALLCDGVLTFTKPDYDKAMRRADRLLTSRLFGFPLMFVLLLGVFWLTITGANLPSELLAKVLFGFEEILYGWFTTLPVPAVLGDILIHGAYRTLAWVVSVMLPPMAIFFPLFTLLEDSGYLPRIAFNMDAVLRSATPAESSALRCAWASDATPPVSLAAALSTRPGNASLRF